MTGKEGTGPEDTKSTVEDRPTRTNIDLGLTLSRGDVLAERYRIDTLLGVGGMGMVYRARDERLGMDVAVKILRPELGLEPDLRERFRQEVILARQVSHPNVVRIHDLARHGDLLFLTMDFVEGRSLRQVLGQDGPMEPARAKKILRQLGAALAVAHARGVVHRDLKPGNILINAEDEAYITDFGIARSLSEVGLTRSGVVVGTLEYLSPEQARGEEVDGRSDLYALGVIYYEMLTGQSPFPRGSQAEMLAQRMSGSVNLGARLAELPEDAGVILERLLALEPEHRFSDAGHLLRFLDGALEPTVPLDPMRRPFVRRILGPLLLVLALGLGVAAVVRWGGGDAVPRAVVEKPLVVAVLPIENESGREELAWTSRGVAERLSWLLSEYPELRVADSVRVFRLLDDLGHGGRLPRVTLRNLAQLLDSDYLVGGTLRSFSGQLRLELVVYDDGGIPRQASHELAAQVSMDGLYQAADDLGEILAREVFARRVEIPREGRPSAVPAALESYALGLDHLAAGKPAAAAESFETAVAADPALAPAWLRLSEVSMDLGNHQRALEAAERAEAEAAGNRRTQLEARARRQWLEGDVEAARGQLEELVELYPGALEVRLLLAEVTAESGEIEAAQELLLKVTEEVPGHPEAWFLLAKHAILSGEDRRAVDEYLVRALVLANRRSDDRLRGDVQNAFGLAYEHLGALDEAEESYRRAARIRERILDHRGFAVTLRNLAAVHSMRGEHEEALADLDRARKLLEELEDHGALAELYDVYGVLEEERGRYDRALDYYRRALNLRNDLGDRLGLADSFNNVGFAYYLLGEYDNAQVYWRQLLGLREAAGDRRGRVLALQNLGQLQIARGEWDLATRSFIAALEESRGLVMLPAVAVSQGYLGRLAQLEGRYGAAFTSYGEALKVLRELEDRRGLVEFTLFEGEAALELGDLGGAAEQLERVAAWLEEVPNQAQLAQLDILRGTLAVRRGETGAARRAFAAALEAAEASQSVVLEHYARLGSLTLEANSGGGSETAEALEEQLDEVERLGNARLVLRVAEGLARLRLERGEPELALSVLERTEGPLRRVGFYGGAYRLLALEARAKEASGGDGEATRAAARVEIDRLLASLEGERRDFFNRLPEVRELAEKLDQ